MIIAKKNAAYYLSFPAIDSASPASYKSGISPVDTAYYKDGAGAWTSLSIADTATEIGSTGVYEIDLTADELDHDKVIIKFAVSGMADDAYQFDLRTQLTDDLPTAADVNTQCDSAISDASLATAAALTTVDTVVDAIKAVTDNLPNSGALTDLSTAAALTTVDTVVDAIKAVTDNLPNSGALTDLATAASLTTVDTVVDAIKAVTDNLPNSGALTDLATAAALATVDTIVDQILADTGTDGVVISATTANQLADALLNRDMSVGTDSGSTTVRTPRQALRFLRNYWDVSGTTLTVRKEDDATASWTATVSTDSGADPVTGSNPAGGS
jgi:hypothetical protein